MEVIHERCAGLDVHKETVVGCLRVREPVKCAARCGAGQPPPRSSWSSGTGCGKRAARTWRWKRRGIYWKPVWHVLEGEFELILANPAHIRNVPGRKSDVNDATWIADLLARRRGPGRWPAGAAPRLEQTPGYGGAGRGWTGA